MLHDRKGGLLIPQIAQVVALHRGIVQPHVGLFWPPNPVDAWRLPTDGTAGAGQRNRLRDDAEERTLVRAQHEARIEVDHDGQHVVVLQKVGQSLQGPAFPREVKRVGA
jgi:hypothetical protein